MHTFERTDTDPPKPPPLPTKITSVDDIRMFMDALHRELEDIRASWKNTQSIQRIWYKSLIEGARQAIATRNPDVMERELDNIASTMEDLLRDLGA